MKQLIKQYHETGEKLNQIKHELRTQEFKLKTTKLNLEFDPEFTRGLKVKEIPHKIHNETLQLQEEICQLKQQKDQLELEFNTLKYEINYSLALLENKEE